MTDRDERTEARLRAAFLSEERRAGSDLRLDPVFPRATSRHAGTLARLAAFAFAAVLVVSALGLAVVSRGNSASGNTATATAGIAATPSVSPAADRYGDGIPRTFQGQPVLRWGDALARSQTATDDTPFLVAVWLDVYRGPIWCLNIQVDPSAPDSWVNSTCTGIEASADAGAQAVALDGVATFRFAAIAGLTNGPAILRVHTHDPRSAECGNQEAVCKAMMVVDTAVWTGDAGTEPQPFTVADVIRAAAAMRPSAALEIATTQDIGWDMRLPGAIALSAPSPWLLTPADKQLVGAYLMPSDDAMRRELPDVHSGAAGAILPAANKYTRSGSGPGYSYTVDERWLVVDNVAFSVRTASPPTADDEAWLANIEAALRAASGSPSQDLPPTSWTSTAM